MHHISVASIQYTRYNILLQLEASLVFRSDKNPAGPKVCLKHLALWATDHSVTIELP